MRSATVWPESQSSRLLVVRKRLVWARAIMVAMLLVFVGRAVQWTLFEGDHLARRAESNMVTRRWVNSPRGAIYDAHGNPLARNVRTYRIDMAQYRNRADDVRRTVAELETLLHRSLTGVADRVLSTESRWDPVPVANGLSLDEITPILERRPTLAGVRVEEEDRREYPLGRSAGLIVGYTGKLWPSEVDLAREKGWPLDHRLGRAGLERYYEEALCGVQGREAYEHDARGRRLRTLVEESGLPGKDLITTIDSDLQRRAYELLAGHRGVIAAMDVNTGALLALAVRPSIDPSGPGREAPEGDENSYLNRATMQHYPPGSPFKIVTSLASLLHGHTLTERRECQGSLLLEDRSSRPFYCDNRAGHGWLGPGAAIKYSCNVYFYGLAVDIGPGALLDTARLLELDKPTGVDLPDEEPGTLGEIRPDTIDGVEEVLLGIGQGPLALTPLQVLRLMAAVANHGKLVRPHIGSALVSPTSERIALDPPAPVPINVPDWVWIFLSESMHRVVNEDGGTAFRAAFPPEWNVCGKTGTAEHPPGEPDAWFAGFAPLRNPEIAFVVLLEHAGHGGDVSAPLARELLAAYFGSKAPPVPEMVEEPVSPDFAPEESEPSMREPGPVSDGSGRASGVRMAPGGGEEARDDKPGQSAGAAAAIEISGSVATDDAITTLPRSLTDMMKGRVRPASDYEWVRGGLIRGPREKKEIALVFTGGDFGEGGDVILDALKARGIRGAFFFTGDFIRKPHHIPIVKRILTEGHYLGPHSDKHLLYCPWEDRNKTLVTREEFTADLKKNIDDLCALGAKREEMTWWIPPYEWYNEDIARWSLEAGIRLFNFTPGTLSHTDYTEADAKNYRSSDVIYNSILEHEAKENDGLNGFLLLTHIGSSPKRTDKFFVRLGSLVDELSKRGYRFVRLDAMLKEAPPAP